MECLLHGKKNEKHLKMVNFGFAADRELQNLEKVEHIGPKEDGLSRIPTDFAKCESPLNLRYGD
tara:strand:- start:854 stop:1045 length:192 start_codon:yes stop_codon:yes gene_type:complete